MKVLIHLFFLTILCSALHAQNRTVYVAARSGLSLREQPSTAAKLLDKIPYGTKLSVTPIDTGSAEIITEGMTGYWEKTYWNGKSGYIVNAYVLPIAPPKTGNVSSMEDYFKQVFVPFGNKLVIKEGVGSDNEEDDLEKQKQLYKNGAEWHRLMAYEYGSDTWFLPKLSIQEGFLLMRLIPEFNEVFPENSSFPKENKTWKIGEREFMLKVEKETYGDNEWIKKISVEYEDGAVYTLEIFLLENDLVIFHSGGL